MMLRAMIKNIILYSDRAKGGHWFLDFQIYFILKKTFLYFPNSGKLSVVEFWLYLPPVVVASLGSVSPIRTLWRRPCAMRRQITRQSRLPAPVPVLPQRPKTRRRTDPSRPLSPVRVVFLTACMVFPTNCACVSGICVPSILYNLKRMSNAI